MHVKKMQKIGVTMCETLTHPVMRQAALPPDYAPASTVTGTTVAVMTPPVRQAHCARHDVGIKRQLNVHTAYPGAHSHPLTISEFARLRIVWMHQKRCALRAFHQSVTVVHP